MSGPKVDYAKLREQEMARLAEANYQVQKAQSYRQQLTSSGNMKGTTARL